MTGQRKLVVPIIVASALMLLLMAFVSSGCAFRSLLYDVSVTPERFSPNADGDTDVTQIFYKLRRSATLSIYFENEQGERFLFPR